MTEIYFVNYKAKLKAIYSEMNWMPPFRIHGLPKLGARPVNQICHHPLWETMNPSLKKKVWATKKALILTGKVEVVLKDGRRRTIWID